MQNRSVVLSYRALQAEMILSPMVMTMAVMNLFFAELGLTEAQIGITQATFTSVVMLLNIWLGKLADHANRAVMNACGDFLAACGLCLYAVATNLWMVIAAETIFAIGFAASSGADGSLLRGYCDRLGLNYKVKSAHMHTYGAVTGAFGLLIGGFLGQYVGLRAPFWADAAIFGVCVGLSLFVRDYNPKLRRDVTMVAVLRHALVQNKRLSARITAIAPVREATHALVWLTSPVIIAAGLPPWVVGAGMMVTRAGQTAGSYMAGKRLRLQPAAHRLLASFVFCCLGMLLCAIGGPTVFVFVGLACIGIAVGLSRAAAEPIIAEATDASLHTTALSIASTAGLSLYVPVILAITWVLGAYGEAAAYAANAGIFAVLCTVGLLRLRRYT